MLTVILFIFYILSHKLREPVSSLSCPICSIINGDFLKTKEFVVVHFDIKFCFIKVPLRNM